MDNVYSGINCPFCGAEIYGIFGPHPEVGDYFVECSNVDCPITVYIDANNKDEVLTYYKRRICAKPTP